MTITAELKKVLEALGSLVRLKAHKDAHGKDNYYLVAQPIAWKDAKEALVALPAIIEQVQSLEAERAWLEKAQELVEAVARAICNADPIAPEPDAPIMLGLRTAKAWEARVPMAKAAIAAVKSK